MATIVNLPLPDVKLALQSQLKILERQARNNPRFQVILAKDISDFNEALRTLSEQKIVK